MGVGEGCHRRNFEGFKRTWVIKPLGGSGFSRFRNVLDKMVYALRAVPVKSEAGVGTSEVKQRSFQGLEAKGSWKPSQSADF